MEETLDMKKLLTFTALPALAMVAACGPDSPREEMGDRMEERADAIEDVGNDRAEALEERADEAETDAREDMLNERAEEIDDIGDEAADEINEVADELE
ncbi:hypothetical protein [Erythrobacter litoralis]|jgi:F0F1-type ATP synthase membrane subunit b/b'|nr:hypothetical protein [Erythrobacter litoralis]